MLDLVKDYEETDSGKYLKSVLVEHIKNNLLTEANADKVFSVAAKEYDRYINNPKNAWDSVKLYLKQCPDIFSLLDIINYEIPVNKFFYIVSSHNSQEVVEIFNLYNRSYEKYEKVINGNNLCIFVSIVTYSNMEEKKLEWKLGPRQIGYDIFGEIEEKRKIKVGFHYYSLDTRNFISLSDVRSLKINEKIIKYSSGYRSDLGIGFRSAWEANIARILNYLGALWEYETKSFLLKDEQYSGYYFPDFILPNNIIIEVKGFWSNNSRQKVRLFNLQFPEYTLLCIDGDLLYDLENRFKNLISNWEDIDCHINRGTIQVVGINRGERSNNVKALSVGDKLTLKRDPSNEYDSNAIKVSTSENKEIGFVSKDWACIYSHKIDLGIKYIATVKEIEPKVIEVFIKRTNVESEIIHDIFKD